MDKRGVMDKYPNFTLFILTFILAFMILKSEDFGDISKAIVSMGYAGTFLAGTLYTYSFSTAPAAVFLLILAGSQNIFLATIIGSVGAMLGDLLIFNYIKHDLKSEIKEFSKFSIIKKLNENTPKKLKNLVLTSLGVFFIVAPFPDELGIFFLENTKILRKKFAVISFMSNFIGIFLLLFIGKVFF